jgi:hypothetical protein
VPGNVFGPGEIADIGYLIVAGMADEVDASVPLAVIEPFVNVAGRGI